MRETTEQLIDRGHAALTDADAAGFPLPGSDEHMALLAESIAASLLAIAQMMRGTDNVR